MGGLGAAAGVGGLGVVSTGCSSIGESLVPLTKAGEPDIDKVLENLDNMMGAIRTMPIQSISGLLKDRKTNDAKLVEEHFRRVLRSLMVVGTVRDLPLAYQLHPGVQVRVQLSMPELDDTIVGSKKLIESLTPEDRKRIGDAFRKDPELPMRLFGDIDREAATAGVPLTHRLAMRRVVHHVTFRLKQSTEMFLDEQASSYDRIRARVPAGGLDHQALAAKAAEEQLWQQQEQIAAARRLWEGRTIAQAQPPPGMYGPPMPMVSEEERKREKRRYTGHVLLTVGGISFGIGAVLSVIGGFLLANPPNGEWGWGALSVTFGVVFGLTGLILLIVGAVFAAS